MASLADLQRRIETVREKERKVVMLIGISKTVVALVSVIVAYFLVDWLFDLPYLARLVGALLGLGTVGYVCNKHLLKELKKIRDDDEIALRIESRNPDLRGRLISTLQLTREGKRGAYVGSPELLKALEVETVRMSDPLDFSRIINKDMLKKFGLAALGVVVIKAVLIIEFPEHFKALGGRLISAEARFPTKTRIKEVLVPDYVARGDDIPVKVVLEADSRIPPPDEPGSAQFTGKGGGRVSVELTSKGEAAVFVGTLTKPTEDMTVIAKVGDAVSFEKSIRVLARPEVDSANSTIQYTLPAYTKASAPAPEKFGGLTILQGSVAEIRITATKPLVSAALKRSDGQSFELKKADPNGLVWHLPSIPVDKSGSFHMDLLDTDKLTNAQPPVEYPIDARADHQPSIKLTRPSRDITVTANQRVKVMFSARDDYNIRNVWIAYKIQNEGAATGGEVKRDELAYKGAKDFTDKDFIWDLSNLGLKVGDQVVFWLEADDDCTTNNDNTPRRRPGDTEAVMMKGQEEKLYSNTADVKLSVVSREDKIAEWEAEIQRLYQRIETHKEEQEELTRKIVKLLEVIDELKKE
ncbi:MAG TPA: DUF4175 family protein [Planctomycetota bacterium]|nr:DUF4175 family protein [Planctomycetota bacterium]